MPSMSTIIDYCISVNNKSGSIPAAPQGLKQLKESIEGVPFELLTQGMSGILNQGNLMQGIQQIAQQMGGIQNLGGQVQQILGQITNGTASTAQIVQAVGGVTAMTAGLSSSLPADAQAAIASIAPGTINKTGG